MLKSALAWKVRCALGFDILDFYTQDPPSGQKTVDIFKGEWASDIPGYDSGLHPLFDDKRIHWFEKMNGSFKGKRILELGPLEAGHSYMLHNFGAKSILAIEGNSKSYLKCLIIKDLFHLTNLSLEFSEIISYLEREKETYDTILALGVLYHMVRPLEFIKLTASLSDKVCLWTHYFDEKAIKKNGHWHKFGKNVLQSFDGMDCDSRTYLYRSALGSKKFYGGFNPFSYWLPKDAIIEAYRYFGMETHTIEYDDPNTPNGPAFCVYLTK